MSEQKPICSSNRNYGATAATPAVAFAYFSQAEFHYLTERIADHINTINSGRRSLEKMMKLIGGPFDNMQLRGKIHHTQQRVNRSELTRLYLIDIQRLSVLVRRGDELKRWQVEQFRQVFMVALSNYSSVQKQVSERMSAHMPREARVKNNLEALEQQDIADDEEASLLANQQAQTYQLQFETSMLHDKEAYNQVMQQSAEAQAVDTVEQHIEVSAAEPQHRHQILLHSIKIIILIILIAILSRIGAIVVGIVDILRSLWASAAEPQRRHQIDRKKIVILIILIAMVCRIVAMVVGILDILWSLCVWCGVDKLIDCFFLLLFIDI